MSSCNELSMSWQRLMFRNFRQRPATSEEQLLKFFNFLANSISISMASDRVINTWINSLASRLLIGQVQCAVMEALKTRWRLLKMET